MAKVIIVGAGIAGLSAALRLLQRGFDVTLLEQDDFLGGKLGAHQDLPAGPVQGQQDAAGHIGWADPAAPEFVWIGGRSKKLARADVWRAERAGGARRTRQPRPAAGADWHEHSYHMYLNWYLNFWRIVDELGLRDRFMPAPTAHHLRPLRPGQRRADAPLDITNVGSPSSFWENMFSGLMSPPDMFLYGYSLLDVIGTPARNAELLERTSVLGFLASRPYATEEAINQHYRTLANAFACPSYLTALRSYKTFIRYGTRQPAPMMWLLKGNAYECLFGPLERRLRETAWRLRRQGARLDIRRLTHVNRLRVERGRIAGLETLQITASPGKDRPGPIPVEGHCSVPVGDADVILAVPPKALQQLVGPEVLGLALRLGHVSQLRALPMASLDLYFHRRLDGVPEGITLLLDSNYAMSFLDVSRLWPELRDKDKTVLNVVASDVGILATYPHEPVISLLCKELRRFIPFEPGDLVEGRAYLQSNVGEELFINQVGSWDYRPTTTCGIPNLFIAGDYCQTCIDVVTIEGAVVSGLMAAEEVRRHQGHVGAPIEILEPPSYPEPSLAMMKLLGAPWAYAAKALSGMDHALRGAYRGVFPNG